MRKNYGRQTLYDGVDASIIRGDRIGLLGKNGAGKSTLFKILMGQETLDGGRDAPRPEVLDRLSAAGDPPAPRGDDLREHAGPSRPWTAADRRLKAVMNAWNRRPASTGRL